MFERLTKTKFTRDSVTRGRKNQSSGFLFVRWYGKKYLVIWFLFIRSSGFGLMPLSRQQRPRSSKKMFERTYQDNDDTEVDHESDGEYVVPPEIIEQLS